MRELAIALQLHGPIFDEYQNCQLPRPGAPSEALASPARLAKEGLLSNSMAASAIAGMQMNLVLQWDSRAALSYPCIVHPVQPAQSC